jgi:hypothetical protein
VDNTKLYNSGRDIQLMNKLFQKASLLFVAVFMSAGLLAPVLVSSTAQAAPCNDNRGALNLPYWWRGLCDDAGNAKPQLKSPADIWKVVLNGIEIAMILAGYFAVGYVIWGGFKYLTSDGDEGRLTAARKIITNALVGLGIVLASVAMTSFVAGLL